MFTEDARQFHVAMTRQETERDIRRHGINNHLQAVGEARYATANMLAKYGRKLPYRLLGRFLRWVYRKYGQ